MVGVESQRNSILAEDAAVRRQYEDDRNQIYGGDGDQGGQGEIEMPGDAIFIAGDVVLPPEQKPTPQPVATAPATPATAGNPLLTAALAAALGAGTGVGGMALYNAATKPAETAAVRTDKPAVETPKATDTTGTIQKDQ